MYLEVEHDTSGVSDVVLGVTGETSHQVVKLRHAKTNSWSNGDVEAATECPCKCSVTATSTYAADRGIGAHARSTE